MRIFFKPPSNWVYPLMVIAIGAIFAIIITSPIPAVPAADSGLMVESPPRPTEQPSENRHESITLTSLRAIISLPDPVRRRRRVDDFLALRKEDAPVVHRLLHRRTDIPAPDYKNVLRAVGALVPDHLGRFPKTDEATNKQPDWLAALLQKGQDNFPPALRTAYLETTLSVLLIRALAQTQHPDASLSLLRFAYRHQSAFKDECGRQIRTQGIWAVPGLLRAKILKDPLAFKMVRYAAYQLDRMNLTRPDLALKKADRNLRAELLHAYGEIRDSTAVNAVLKYCSDSSEKIERAARWALLRYLSGRPPKVIKRKLVLPGGRLSTNERALYLTYRQLANQAIKQRLTKELSSNTDLPVALSSVLGQDSDEELEPRYLAERLFALFDQRRDQMLEKAFQQALAAVRKDQTQETITHFDRFLSAQPNHPQRHLMAPYYYKYGTELLQHRHYDKASFFFTKAMHLDPQGSFVQKAIAQRILSETLLKPEQSDQESQWKLRSAVHLAPRLRQAREELIQLERTNKIRLLLAVAISASIVAAFLIGLIRVRQRIFKSS